ncbi:MAG: tRNA uridine-5-carboxymethylaminomethyl(34) synthesis enzyme MnmG [Candidatus Omnitrophica bacterium]|nr:tRNA uridine-5-carboxymethylaminomethyl(34) synthesis enzyme MnmG [Candidatus Omnitrophota bacterium]
MNAPNKTYDCIVIGSGHSGVEAALVCARMGCDTLMINLSFDTIGQMSCNPAIGGVGKGQLVKEIDALGGEMGKAADKTGIQFRQLNASKGPAVRSSRCQSDRKQYRAYMQNMIRSQKNLFFLEGKVFDILTKENSVCGVRLETGQEIYAKTLVLTPGTFLNGKIHVGKKTVSAGRINESSSDKLADSLKSLGFELLSFKTGTPPRLDGKTIDFSQMVRQDSDEIPMPFSFSTSEIPETQKLLPCYITATNLKTHKIIKDNIHLSPMYSGKIKSTGVRYCPSIEDKLVKFSAKEKHQIFLEPEGAEEDVYYPNGISTGLPEDVQEKMVHSIKGLENARIVRYGYSIEHGVISSTELKASLESKRISGLFCAGQINGTTGYEEAAAQGLVAGINAALKVKNQQPFILRRDESYIGVLIDDLVTKGTEEPYRMFTSRVEYRLIVREDNADKRMCEHAYRLGLIDKERYDSINEKYDLITKKIEHLRQVRVDPGEEMNKVLSRNHSAALRNTTRLAEILKRPGISYKMIASFDDQFKKCSKLIIDQVEYEIKYQGFIARQQKDIERFKHLEYIKIPEGFDYSVISGLSIEIQQKLKHFAPQTLGQAHRISGVTPAAISILMIYLKKQSFVKN